MHLPGFLFTSAGELVRTGWLGILSFMVVQTSSMTSHGLCIILGNLLLSGREYLRYNRFEASCVDAAGKMSGNLGNFRNLD